MDRAIDRALFFHLAAAYGLPAPPPEPATIVFNPRRYLGFEQFACLARHHTVVEVIQEDEPKAFAILQKRWLEPGEDNFPRRIRVQFLPDFEAEKFFAIVGKYLEDMDFGHENRLIRLYSPKMSIREETARKIMAKIENLIDFDIKSEGLKLDMVFENGALPQITIRVKHRRHLLTTVVLDGASGVMQVDGEWGPAYKDEFETAMLITSNITKALEKLTDPSGSVTRLVDVVTHPSRHAAPAA